MRSLPCVVLACLGAACGGYLETDDASPRQPEARPREAPEPARTRGANAGEGGLHGAVGGAIADARAQKEHGARCTDGLVKVDQDCGPCSRDDQCPTGSCLADTQRCAAEGWCEQDEHCGAGQRCDGGLCLHDSSASTAPCGLPQIQFAWDSARIGDTDRARLVAAAPCLSALETVYVEAHADAVGSEEFNILLSERRGLAVRDLLVDAGVPRDRLRVIAKGSLEAGGDGTAPLARDRRVNLIAP